MAGRTGATGFSIWLLVLLLPVGAQAQTVSAPASAPPPIEEILSLADRNLPRMTLPVRIGASAVRDFIVDTGADRTVISIDSARELQLQPSSSVKLHTMNGVDIVPTVLIPKLQVASTTIVNIRAPALAAQNIGADGVLGIDSLKNKRITIDFRTRELSIAESRTPDVWDEPNQIVITAKSRFGQLILVDADVDGRRIHVILDTGAENSIGNDRLRKLIARRSGGYSPLLIGLTGVTGEVTNAEFAKIDRIRLGGFTITNVPIAFAEVHPFKRFGLTSKPALMLGMDVLRIFDRVSIDFARRKIKFLLPGDARPDAVAR